MGGRQVLAARRLLADALGDGLGSDPGCRYDRGGPGVPGERGRTDSMPESARDEEERVAAARRAVATLGAPDRLPDLLAELAAGEGDAPGCARLSYRHVLGFDKLMLIDVDGRHLLRAHVWHRGGTGPAAEDIHNHRSTLASYVVRGRLSMELYEPDDEGRISAVRYQESLTPDAAADWLLEPAGPARLRLTHSARYAAGSAYALPPRTLHRAWCDTDALTVTLFLETARRRRPHTDVFAPAGPRSHAVPKLPLPVPDYLTALSRLSELLTSQ